MRTGELLLLGRDAEVARLFAALAPAGPGGTCVLVLGAPGIGKSELADATADEARRRGFTVLATSGVPSEAHLPFAGLHQLLQPVLGHAADLPSAQRAALLGALGHEDADVHDTMAVAVAVLALLGERAADGPLLVVVEDTHWLDRPTADVLAFVARRLAAEPIVLVATSRDRPTDALADVRFAEVALGPVDDGAARAIVGRHAPMLDPALVEQLIGEAAGNPLALVELSAAWARLPPGTIVPSLVPVTDRLVATFAARVDTLPVACRDMLLVAAIDEGEGLGEILAATAGLGHPRVTHDDLFPAVEARLVDVGARGVRFRHPLVRSAIHHRAKATERRAAHAALAAVLHDPDRVAWHRAAAALGPDEDVAGALEQAAARARRRGAVLVAITALERAADLSPDPARRGRRLVQAAHHAHDLGRQDVVRRLLDEAEPLDLDPVDRARAARRRQALVDEGVGDPDQLRVLVGIVERLGEAGDADMALESLIAVAGTAWRMGVENEEADLIVHAAESLPVDRLDARVLNVLGLVAPVRRRSVVLERLPAAARAAADDPVSLALLGTVAGIVGDQVAACALLAGASRSLRAQGRFGTLANALVSLAWSAWHLGDWRTTSGAAEEARRLGEQTDRPGSVVAARLVAGAVSAVRGDAAAAEAAADEVAAVVRPAGATTVVALTDLVRGLALAARSRPELAYEVLAPYVETTADTASAAVAQAMVPTYVDAALASAHVGEARAVVGSLERVGRANGSPTLAASLAYARPLVAGDGRAEELFVRAIDTDLTRWPFLRARAQLAYGSWLRRRRRAVESRVPLRAARAACAALGATPWADRARGELRAAGEPGPAVEPAAVDRLTAQELEIARLAASGLTNREIGRQLYLSHRTVGSHLYHVFPKLGITSRGELAAALGEAV